MEKRIRDFMLVETYNTSSYVNDKTAILPVRPKTLVNLSTFAMLTTLVTRLNVVWMVMDAKLHLVVKDVMVEGKCLPSAKSFSSVVFASTVTSPAGIITSASEQFGHDTCTH